MSIARKLKHAARALSLLSLCGAWPATAGATVGTDTEFLIVTHEDFQSAAETLSEWKNQKGLVTAVVNLSTAGPDTTAIQSYVKSVYDDGAGTLQYVLFIGDDDYVPTFQHDPTVTLLDAPIASDLDYADFDGDMIADLAYGRIPVRTEEDANTVVNKILDYEKTPPFNDDYYDTYLFSSYFAEESQNAGALTVTGVYFTAASAGESGNLITVQFTNPPADASTAGGYAANQSETITVAGTAIQVKLGTNATGAIDTTAQGIEDVITANASASALVSAAVYAYGSYTAATLQRALGPFPLTGGAEIDGIEDDEYVSNSEEIYDVVALGGKTVNRKYVTEDLPWPATDPNGPEYFYNGDPLPSDLLYANGYPWTVSATDLTDEFNDGRAIVLHRDHAQITGWQHPQFITADFTTLTNGDSDAYDSYEDLLPVVFSINCQSGIWDTTDESFAEGMLNKTDGGAVAVIASSALSYTFLNNDLAKGVFDTVWDDVTTDVSNGGETYRLGDILNYAKLYMYSEHSSSSGVDTGMYEFEVLGDPTLEMWTDTPSLFDVAFKFSKITANTLDVRFTTVPPDGTSITVFQGGSLVATGTKVKARLYNVDVSGFDATAKMDMFITAPGYRPYLIENLRLGKIIHMQSELQSCYENGGPYYGDHDGDGFGKSASKSCTPAAGYVSNSADCNDRDADSNPNHAEVCGDDADNNCNDWADEACDEITLDYTTTTGLGSIDVGSYSAPEITDLDGDGLFDVLIGNSTGTLWHYEQNSANSTSFTKVSSSFSSIDVGDYSFPAFTDLDGDGLLDLLIGEKYGTISHYEQSAVNGLTFTLVTANFGSIDVGLYAYPEVTDWDGDGLLDLFVGGSIAGGGMNRYEQTARGPSEFDLVSTGNFSEAGSYDSADFADLDNDGLIDVIMGAYQGDIIHYEQTSANSTESSMITDAFFGIVDSVNQNLNPATADINGDGYVDFLIGQYGGTLDYYEFDGP